MLLFNISAQGLTLCRAMIWICINTETMDEIVVQTIGIILNNRIVLV
jgi:hypothetical protein